MERHLLWPGDFCVEEEVEDMHRLIAMGASFFIAACYGATELEARSGLDDLGPPMEEPEIIAPSSKTAPSSTPAPSAPEPICSTGLFWEEDEDDGSPQMNPGRPCISCHLDADDDDAPRFIVAGTVYATLHELDRCQGVDGARSGSDAHVEVTDAKGTIYRLPIGATGNFFLRASSAPGFEMPFTARVLANGQERRMGGAQSSGDCNQCHTAVGNHGAPGRILFPG